MDQRPWQVALVVLGLSALAIFVEQMVRHRTEGAFCRVACTMLAVLYLGVGLALVLLIRMEHGVATLVLFVAAVKFTDIGAYFTGSAIGRHKLIPWLSPGKKPGGPVRRAGRGGGSGDGGDVAIGH